MSAIAFHLAAPIRDLEETRLFYRDLLGCVVGREAETWIDFDSPMLSTAKTCLSATLELFWNGKPGRICLNGFKPMVRNL